VTAREPSAVEVIAERTLPAWLVDAERLAANIYYTTGVDGKRWGLLDEATRSRFREMAEKILKHLVIGMSRHARQATSECKPEATEVIAEATYRSLLGSWTYDSPVERAVAMWDPRPTAERALAALKAAGFVVATRDEIRAMSPSEQAELIGGYVDEGYFATINGRLHRRALGPWCEVQP
jgi:hypothetical protein